MPVVKTRIVTEKYTVNQLLDQVRTGVILDNSPLQRDSDMHTKSYKDAFIATVIKNEDFDSIKVCEQKRDNGVILWLIDGLQRVSEIQDYREGAFKLGKGIEFPIVEYQVTRMDENGNIVKDEDGMPVYELKKCDINGMGYEDLPKELRKQFDFCPLEVVKHLDCTDAEIAYHIRRYNKQVPLNGSQNAMTYTDKWAAMIKTVAHNRFFLDCGRYTANEHHKGGVNRVVLESVMSTFHIQDWKKNPTQMGKYANDNVTADEIKTIDSYFTRLYPIADGKYDDIFNSKNTLIFIPVFDVFAKTGLDDSVFGGFLDAFEMALHSQEIDGVSYDTLMECRATKDKNRIIEKIEHIKKLLNQYLNHEQKNSNVIVMDEGIVTKIPGITVEEFISQNIGVSVHDVEEDMEFYNSCLDDAMDRTIPLDSKLYDPMNRFSLLAATAYTIVNDMDIESCLDRYAQTHNDYLTDQRKNYEQMIGCFNDFSKQEIA